MIFSTLAAFGAVCVLWMLFDFLLPGAKSGVMVCQGGSREEAVIGRYLWLHGAGLLRCPLVLLDSHLPEKRQAQITEKYQNIHFCSLQSFTAGLQKERERLG